MLNTIDLNNELLFEFIKVLPDLFLVLFFFIVFVFSYKLIKNDLLPNIKGFSAYGVTIELLEDNFDSIVKVADKNSHWNVHVPAERKNNVIKRAKKSLNVLNGLSILWFDDQPVTFVNEVRMLSQVGISVDIVTSVEQALLKLETGKYDLMVSDIDRGIGQENGISTLKQVHDRGHNIKTIFYIGRIDDSLGTPPHGFGITNSPDELLHLIIDIAERI